MKRLPLLEGWHLLKGGNVVVLYHLSASEIWPVKRGGFVGWGLIMGALLYSIL